MPWCCSVQRFAFEQSWYLCLDVALYKDLHLSNADTYALMLPSTKTCIWAMLTLLPWCCSVQRLAFEQSWYLCLDVAQYKDLHLSKADTYALILLSTKTCIWAKLIPMPWCCSVQRFAFEQSWYLCLDVALYKDLHLSNADTYALMLPSTKTCIWAMLTLLPWCCSVQILAFEQSWYLCLDVAQYKDLHLSKADTYALMLLSTKTCIWAKLIPMPWCCSVQRLAFEQCWYLCLDFAQYKDLHLSRADTYALMLLSTKICIWAKLIPMPWCCSVQRLAFEQCWYLCLDVAQYKDLHLSNADTSALMLLSTKTCIWAILIPMPWCCSVQRFAFEQSWYLCLDVALYKDLHLSNADTYALMLPSTKTCIWAMLTLLPWCCSVQRLAFEQSWYLCLDVAQYKDLHLSKADTYALILLSTKTCI